MSCIILLICDRADCESRAEIEIGGDLPALRSINDEVREAEEAGAIEPGWGVDVSSNRVDTVLHCPLHRS